MKIKEWLWNRMRCRCRYRLLICAFQENRLSKLEPYYTNTNALDWKLWKVTTHFDIESTARKWSEVFWVWMDESNPSQVYKYRMERDRKKHVVCASRHSCKPSLRARVCLKSGVLHEAHSHTCSLTHIHNLSYRRLPHKRFIMRTIYILLE